MRLIHLISAVLIQKWVFTFGFFEFVLLEECLEGVFSLLVAGGEFSHLDHVGDVGGVVAFWSVLRVVCCAQVV